MENTRINLRQRVARGAAALAAAGVLVAGATWHGFAADTAVSVPQVTTTSTPPIGHSIAGGRDSYADVVKIVAEAVVTVRTEGKARVSPTRFGGDQDEMLRRFFGDRFGREPFGDQFGREPRIPPPTSKQRGLGS